MISAPARTGFVGFVASPLGRIQNNKGSPSAANDTAPWGAADWQAYFDERAGIAEFDGGLTRKEAEVQAYRSCLSEWMRRNFQPSEPGGHCAWCQRGDLTYGPVMPYGSDASGHVWLHSECWAAWYAQRRQAAVAALKTMGLHEGGPGA